LRQFAIHVVLRLAQVVLEGRTPRLQQLHPLEERELFGAAHAHLAPIFDRPRA